MYTLKDLSKPVHMVFIDTREDDDVVLAYETYPQMVVSQDIFHGSLVRCRTVGQAERKAVILIET